MERCWSHAAWVTDSKPLGAYHLTSPLTCNLAARLLRCMLSGSLTNPWCHLMHNRSVSPSSHLIISLPNLTKSIQHPVSVMLLRSSWPRLLEDQISHQSWQDELTTQIICTNTVPSLLQIQVRICSKLRYRVFNAKSHHAWWRRVNCPPPSPSPSQHSTNLSFLPLLLFFFFFRREVDFCPKRLSHGVGLLYADCNQCYSIDSLLAVVVSQRSLSP